MCDVGDNCNTSLSSTVARTRENDQRPVPFALRSRSHLPLCIFRLLVFGLILAGRSLVCECCLASAIRPDGTGVTPQVSRLNGIHTRPRHCRSYQLIFTLSVCEYGHRRARPSTRRSIFYDEFLDQAYLQRRSTDSRRRLSQRRWVISLNETATEPEVRLYKPHPRTSLRLTSLRPAKPSTGPDRSPPHPVFPAAPDPTAQPASIL